MSVGCAHPTRRVPTLTGTPAQAPDPNPKPNVLQKVGDTTWDVVSAPARLVVPKKPPTREVQTYEAPTAVFTRRNYGEEDLPAAPATTPAPATAPVATQP